MSYAKAALQNAKVDHLIHVGRQEHCDPNWHWVHSGADQSSSMKHGMQAAIRLQSRRAVIVLADMPLVTTELINAVISQTMDHSPATAFDGAKLAPPVCFPSGFFKDILALTGDTGARSMLRDLSVLQQIDCNPDLLRDVDTVLDLKRIAGRLD